MMILPHYPNGFNAKEYLKQLKASRQRDTESRTLDINHYQERILEALSGVSENKRIISEVDDILSKLEA